MWEEGWVAFDTETTGFGKSDRVIEFGAVYFELGEPVYEWSTLINPEDVDWENERVKEACLINGLSREELEKQLPFKEVLPKILLELSVPVWVAHNATFDTRMLNQEMERAGAPSLVLPTLACTMTLARGAGCTRGALSAVAERYDVFQPEAHRASVDAEVSGRIFAEMIRRGEVPNDREALAQFVRKTASLGKNFQR